MELEEDVELRRFCGGGQSKTSILEVHGEKYIIQTKAPIVYENVSQPYINEMLQVQTLVSDIGNQLNQNNLYLPEFLFATSQVSCTKYIEGIEPLESDVFMSGKALSAMSDYIKHKKTTGDKLWQNIELDIVRLGELKTDNFIKAADDKIFFVDPFLYSSPTVLP